MDLLVNETVNITGLCGAGDCEIDMDKIYEKFREDDFQNILIITVLLGILSCVGTLGNLTVLLVFSLRFQKRTSTYFILSLAAIDFFICLFVIPGVIVKTWYYKFYFDWLCKAWEMFRMYSLPTSALLLVAIAFDRYFLICMATNSLMTKCRAKFVIASIAVIGLGLSIPPLLAVGVYQIDEDDVTQVYLGICIENYGLVSVQGIHDYWIFVSVLFGLMTVVIATLYTRVFMTVYKQNKKWRRRHQNTVVPAEASIPIPEYRAGNQEQPRNPLFRLTRGKTTNTQNSRTRQAIASITEPIQSISLGVGFTDDTQTTCVTESVTLTSLNKGRQAGREIHKGLSTMQTHDVQSATCNSHPKDEHPLPGAVMYNDDTCTCTCNFKTKLTASFRSRQKYTTPVLPESSSMNVPAGHSTPTECAESTIEQDLTGFNQCLYQLPEEDTEMEETTTTQVSAWTRQDRTPCAVNEQRLSGHSTGICVQCISALETIHESEPAVLKRGDVSGCGLPGGTVVCDTSHAHTRIIHVSATLGTSEEPGDAKTTNQARSHNTRGHSKQNRSEFTNTRQNTILSEVTSILNSEASPSMNTDQPDSTTTARLARTAINTHQRNTHIKMARVVFMVTVVFIISFLPTFLVSYHVIENEAVFYVYFINNAANPVIYSFMNKKFRTEVKMMFKGCISKLF